MMSKRTVSWLDAGVVCLAGLVALGVFVVQAGRHKTSAQRVQGEADVALTVWTHNSTTLQRDLFKVGETLNLSVRNQPRGALEIADVKVERKELLVPQGTGFKVIEDPTMPNTYDYTVVLKDHALKTPEGYVSNGLKLKVGMPITVEGETYRLDGVLIGLEPEKPSLPAKPLPAAKESSAP